VDKKTCSEHAGVFSVDKCCLLARVNPLNICECGYQVCISVNICANVSVGHYLVGRLLSIDSLETIVPGLLEIVHLAMRCSLLFVEEMWPWLTMTYPTVIKALYYLHESQLGQHVSFFLFTLNILTKNETINLQNCLPKPLN
jgi:hypothetical protein